MTDEKKTDVWMPIWIGSYLADTMDLTTVQHGAYFLLLLAYWRKRGPLADSDDTLRSIAKMDRAEWKRVKPVLAAFFRVADGVWWHKRVEAELIDADKRSKKASEKASSAAQARWGKAPKQPSGTASSTAASNAPSIPQAMPEDILEECPPPSPIPLPSVASVSDETASAAAPAAVDKSEQPQGKPKDRELWEKAGEWLGQNGVAIGAAKAFMNSLAADFGTDVAADALREALKTPAPVDARAFATGVARKLADAKAAPPPAITVPSDAADATQVLLQRQAEHTPDPAPPAAKAALQELRAKFAGGALMPTTSTPAGSDDPVEPASISEAA